MSVATAESIGITTGEFTLADELVFAVPELIDDSELRHKAARFIGAVVTETWNRSEPREVREALTVKPIESLYDAIQAAAEGDSTARKMVEINVATDVVERTIKAGHISKVDLMVDEAGVIQQFGQTMDSIQANSLRFASGDSKMRRRVEAETRNAFRIKHYYDQGTLNDYYFLVFSRAADDMSKKEMTDAGFYTDTMSLSIQVTSAEGNRLTTESAYVAGVENPNAARHDQAATEGLLHKLGIDISGLGATDLLDTPILVHKSLLPDGVVNIVELYDDVIGTTFFGEDKPRDDYQQYRQKCVEREKQFKPTVDTIVTELISEAALIVSPVAATERLHDISEKHMVIRAGEDKTIDPNVFGTKAAAHIEMARWHYDRGNASHAHAEIDRAIESAVSSSCPTGKEASLNSQDGNESSSSEDDAGDCEFMSKECPECHKKNVKTVVKKVSGGKKHISGDCGCSKIC